MQSRLRLDLDVTTKSQQTTNSQTQTTAKEQNTTKGQQVTTASVTTKKENDTTKAVITEEPGAVYAAAEGTVKDIEASTDPTFANKVLGDGVVIFPEDGTVMAPCKATVSLVYPTGHAIGLTTADGAEILIHCGVDTVNMNGEGFETLVKEGQEVTAEEALIRFDIDLVKKHGYSPEILVIFTELPEGKTIKTEEKHIAKNDKMAEIV